MIRSVNRHVKKGIKKVYAKIALLSVELLVVFVLFFVALFAFLFLARMIFLSKKEDFDHAVFDGLAVYVNETNTSIMRFFTFLGTHNFLVPANLALITYFLFIKKHKWYSIKIPVISISSLLLMSVLKELFKRPRPMVPLFETAQGLSFPSGHAMMSVAFYGLILHIIYQNIRNPFAKWILIVLLIVTIGIIGFSRVYLRVHYASDVLAGFSMGCIWLLLSLYILNKMERISKKEIDRVVDPI